jgi:hypothetical protein
MTVNRLGKYTLARPQMPLQTWRRRPLGSICKGGRCLALPYPCNRATDVDKPSVDAVDVKRLKAEGLGASQIAKRLKVGRASVYRVLEG